MACAQTASPAQCFVLAMAMYPDIQKQAQDEIDAVIGRNRLPNLDDIDSLPFINAIVRETFRWQPVLPLCA
jgi:cytochrome P450